MTRTALVTGATGLVGSHIVEQLVREGWRVKGLARSDASADLLRTWNAEPARGDVADRESLAAAAKGADVIFHTAAAITQRGGWESYRLLNIEGTAAVIDAAARSGARLLHLSSVAVYGSAGRYGAEKTHEDTPLGPISERAWYAKSKRDSEQLVMDAHRAGRIWATAVRPDVIYGARDRQFIPRMARALQLGVMPLIGGGNSTLAVVHAANVAEGAILAATSDAAGGRAYNLANDYDVSVREFYRLGAEGLGKGVRFVPVPIWMAKLGLRGFRTVDRIALGGKFAVATEGSLSFMTRDNPFTSDRARRELGWAPSVRPEVGIPAAFGWWAAHRG
ncbi:MAG TPA: NAD-dependent epimerase/dehydratase family protein [Gemmatimonadaceae bacterium]|nr:NAD-dependent epimerase/dehydratase family protein [Gemmatimonadaceae bacterium]